MSRALLDAITALDGAERLVAFDNGLRVGYAHLGDQWITFEETPQGGRNQYFHPDAFAAYAYDAFELVRGAVAAGAASRADVARWLSSDQVVPTAGASRGLTVSREAREATRLLELRGELFVPAAR